MKRMEIAPGAFLTVLPGEKFKRGKLAVHLVVPGRREEATALALLPHILDRRCAAIPSALDLSRKLYALYGAELSSESYAAGSSRILSLGISGLKNEYALAEENLAGEYLDIVCQLLFHPVVEAGAFPAEDVSIEKEKQADYLKSEMNDKRSYCLRQGRRKLYGDSPLGIESAGYLEDLQDITPQSLFAAWQQLLRTAQFEVQVCGLEYDSVAQRLVSELSPIQRQPQTAAPAPALPLPIKLERFTEPMPTTQGKLCIMGCSAHQDDARGEMVMRLASALLGGLPTSRLFTNVREKQSLCYYCTSSYSFFGGVLTMDCGVDHKNATRASKAILKELQVMQQSTVTQQELDNAKSYLRSSFTAAKDSSDALMSVAFIEWLKGMNRSLDEMAALCDSITAQEIQQALARFVPAVEYVITEKEGA